MGIVRGSKSQQTARETFFASVDTAARIYAPAREMCVFSYESFEGSTYQPNVAAKVIGLAFLSAVAAWEDFLEDVYLGYLSGYPAPSGYIPTLRCGPAANKKHALLIAAGESHPSEAERKLKWSSFRWVCNLSEVHFGKENVFRSVSTADIVWLDCKRSINPRLQSI